MSSTPFSTLWSPRTPWRCTTVSLEFLKNLALIGRFILNRDCLLIASKRQRFLINQGYSYKVINRLGELENEPLFYSKKEQQHELLKTVLQANESAADEEDMPSNLKSGGSSSQVYRTTGTLSSLSGGDEGLYMEVSRGSKDKAKHPLFKKFYYTKK